MRAPSLAFVLVFVLVLPSALAQDQAPPPPGGPFGARNGIDGLDLGPQQADTVNVPLNGSITLGFLLTNTGSTPLHLTILGGPGGFGGGFGGRGNFTRANDTSGNFTRNDSNGNFTRNGTRPPRGAMTSTLEGDANITIAPGDSHNAQILVQLTPNATAGADLRAGIVVRDAELNQTAFHMVTIHVVDPNANAAPTTQAAVPTVENHTPGFAVGLLAAAAVIALAVRRRR